MFCVLDSLDTCQDNKDTHDVQKVPGEKREREKEKEERE